MGTFYTVCCDPAVTESVYNLDGTYLGQKVVTPERCYSCQKTEQEFYTIKQTILQAELQGMTAEAAADVGTMLSNLGQAGVDITTLPKTTTLLDLQRMALEKGVITAGTYAGFTMEDAELWGTLNANLTIGQVESLYALTLSGYTSTIDPATGLPTTPKLTSSPLTADITAWALYRNMVWDTATIASATGTDETTIKKLILQGAGVNVSALTDAQINALLATGLEPYAFHALIDSYAAQGIDVIAKDTEATEASNSASISKQQALAAKAAGPAFPIVPIAIITGIVIAGVAVIWMFGRPAPARRVA